MIALLVGVAVAAAAAGTTGFPLALRDADGVMVTVARPPARIVSLAPSVTETLFALGLDREVVAIGDADDHPPERVRDRPRIGGVVINVERVVALRPDLVVGVSSLQRDTLRRLRAQQLPVFAVDAGTLDETVEMIRTVGRVTGRAEAAARLAATLLERARGIRPAPPVRVYVEAWGEPLLAAGASTLVDDLLRRAGGRNVFGDVRGYVQVAAELVLARNPEVILLMYPGRDAVLARPGWRATSAGTAGRVHELPTALVSRPGPRAVDGLAAVAEGLRRAP